MSKSRIRNIMRRTSKVTGAIERGLKQVGTTVKKIANNQPTSSNNISRVFSSLKSRINQGVRQLRGIGKTIKLRSMSRGRSRGRSMSRGRSRGRGRN